MTTTQEKKIFRRFLNINCSQVHYRITGSGPPILLLHPAPLSSKHFCTVMEKAAAFGTVIAPDIPGYGNSDSLECTHPSLENYCSNLFLFLDALNIQSCVALGEKSGAVLLAWMAQQEPHRFNGLVLLNPPYPGKAARDFPSIAPRWDGAHLATLWSFLREDACFSPWDNKTLARRQETALPSTAELHDRAIQVLSSPSLGADYATLLHLTNGIDLSEITPSLQSPTLIVGEQVAKSIYSYPGASVTNSVVERPDGALEKCLSFLRVHRRNHSPVKSPTTTPISGRLASQMVDLPDGQIHVRFNLDANTIPLFVQHDAASSTKTIEPIARSLVGKRTVFAIDLPGSGISDPLIPQNVREVKAYSDYLEAVLDALLLPKIDFYGMWGGGFVGLDLAESKPDRVRRLVMSNLFFHEGEELKRFQNNYTPEIKPVWHGGHLQQCWHQMRDQGLFFPWFDRSSEGVIRREPYLDTNMVHERTCSLLKAGNLYRTAYQSHFVYDAFRPLADINIPVLLATSNWDPNKPHTEEIARVRQNCTFQILDPDFQKWGLSFLNFLE